MNKKTWIKSVCYFLLLALSSGAYAKATPNVFSTRDCKKLSRLKRHPFLLVLYRGQSLIPSIQSCIRDAHLNSVIITGSVGTVERAIIGYYDRDDKKKYLDHFFRGPFELLSLNGNVTWIKGKKRPLVSLHTTLGQRNYSLIGGHLKKAIISARSEIFISPFPTRYIRQHEKKEVA